MSEQGFHLSFHVLGLKSKVLGYLFCYDEIAPLYLCCYFHFTQIRYIYERKAGYESNMERVVGRLNGNKKKKTNVSVG